MQNVSTSAPVKQVNPNGSHARVFFVDPRTVAAAKAIMATQPKMSANIGMFLFSVTAEDSGDSAPQRFTVHFVSNEGRPLDRFTIRGGAQTSRLPAFDRPLGFESRSATSPIYAPWWRQ